MQPVSGPILLSDIPNGKTVVCSAVCQAANFQIVTLVDSNNKTAFQASGNGISPTQIGHGNFTSNGGTYTLSIGHGNSSAPIPPTDAIPSKVLYKYETINSDHETLLGHYVFIAEDGTDNDYNDLYLTISWFGNAG